MPASINKTCKDMCAAFAQIDGFAYTEKELLDMAEEHGINQTKSSPKTGTARKKSLRAFWQGKNCPMAPEDTPEERGWMQICFDNGWIDSMEKGLPVSPTKPKGYDKDEWKALSAEEKEEMGTTKAHAIERDDAYNAFKACSVRVAKFEALMNSEMDEKAMHKLKELEKLKKEEEELLKSSQEADSESDSD